MPGARHTARISYGRSCRENCSGRTTSLVRYDEMIRFDFGYVLMCHVLSRVIYLYCTVLRLSIDYCHTIKNFVAPLRGFCFWFCVILLLLARDLVSVGEVGCSSPPSTHSHRHTPRNTRSRREARHSMRRTNSVYKLHYIRNGLCALTAERD